MELAKAKIGELVGTNQTRNNHDVQFNPGSLRLQITNSVEGGDSRGRQVRQYLGSSSSTLTCDLVFDTADLAEGGKPVSVRTKTAIIERFLVPRGNQGKKYVTPRVRFHWGDLTFDGVVDNITIEMEHFAEDGTPLRAKIGLSIKEQNADLELAKSGPAANAGSPPGKPGAAAAASPGFSLGAAGGVSLGVGGGLSLGAAGGIGLSASANIDVALGGESAADFAVRAGLDPTAWRGLDLGGESSLSLSAGVEVGFSAELNASAGLGVTVGAEAGVAASAEALLGLQVDPKLNAVGGVGVSPGLAAGFALSSAGGVTAAIESLQNSKNVAAEQQTRGAFKVPSPPPAGPAASVHADPSRAANRKPEVQPKLPDQVRAPLRSAGLPSPATPAPASAPRPPKADERASTFGFGVALRPTVAVAAEERAQAISGGARITAKPSSGDPPETTNPTTPAWVALPARDAAQKKSISSKGAAPCGCHCPK